MGRIKFLQNCDDIEFGLWSSNDSRWLECLVENWEKEIGEDPHAYSERVKIPKIIHQIWLGSKPIPTDCLMWMDTWPKVHPAWEYKLWRDKDIEAFGLHNKELYDKVRNPGEKSDIARFEILHRLGGLYVDVDFECLRPLDDLHSRYLWYIGFSNVGRVELNNGLVASIPNHPLVSRIIATIGYSFHDWLTWGEDCSCLPECLKVRILENPLQHLGPLRSTSQQPVLLPLAQGM